MQRGRVQAHNHRRNRISSHGPHVPYILTDISLGAKMDSARSWSFYFRKSKIARQWQSFRKHSYAWKAHRFSVFLFVSVFALCWTPCFVMENVFYKYRRSPTLATAADWVRVSGLLSSLLNPVIYALRYEKFRKAIRHIFVSYWFYQTYHFRSP